jgi:hypothetical protein
MGLWRVARWCGLTILAVGTACGPRAAAPPAPPPTPVVTQSAQVTDQPAPVEVAANQAPSPPPVVPPTVSPAKATIEPSDPGLQLLVEGPGEHAGRRDWTGEMHWETSPQGIVSVDSDGYVRPLKAGEAIVRGRAGEHVVETTITVADRTSRGWEFANDVAPLLTRLGCNTGGCHGKADGQNGFHLSLFGYDPAGDYQAIVRGESGRRLDPFDPRRSLILAKATGRVPHGGGQRVAPGSEAEKLLLAWLKDGAPERSGDGHGSFTRLVVEPGDALLDGPGQRQLRVMAEYGDGHRRDVTRLASFRVNDDSVADVDAKGNARLLRRGEADLVVRYQSKVVATRLATLINPDLSFDFGALPRDNVVDEELFKRLEALRVPPSPLASDAAFLRRVKLDLTGEQPDPTEIRQFLDDTDQGKRAKKIDEYLKSRDFVFFWLVKLGDMLQISPQRFPNGYGYYQEWLRAKLIENARWDGVVRELMTALGNPNSREGAPVNYALDGPDAKVQAEQTAQRFLGLRMRCAQCHDHPFDVWTQDDYYGLAAFFAKVERSAGMPGGMAGRLEVKINPEGKVEHLRTKQAAVPRLPDGTTVDLSEDEDPRKALADWMTRPDNPFFAKATANWVWAQLFGKGLADPPDDLSASNPPVHPELLDALARSFVESGYDLRALIRLIATSRAYGLSSATVEGNEHDTRLFSHHVPRPLEAHQMADALAQATGVKDRYRVGGDSGQLVDKRAIEISDPTTPSPVLDAFGRCTRQAGCSAVAIPTLSLRQSLLVIGGTVVENKVSHMQGYLARVLEFNPEPADLVENLYLRTVCRKPTPEETEFAVSQLADKKGGDLRDAAEDLFWALLNSREFAFNH